ncbi:MAG: DUF4445 domain-containing protein [Firmicutes bacterium]|nr:DUF4445 domain-containing protein [Bacillota bacterium]
MSEYKLLLQPGARTLGFSAGLTISQALAAAGVARNNPCGGKGKCGKCRVLTQGGAPPTAAEQTALTPAELAAGWRLACVSPAVDGMEVRLADVSEQELRILTDEGAGTAGAGWDRQAAGFRLGCDIGTTTVVIYLLHPESGAILHTVSALNGQISFGGDVISRIFAVCDDPGHLAELQAAVTGTLNRLIERLEQETGVTPAQISELRVAGNTTMEHLLLAEDPRGMGKSPFTPAFLEHEAVTAGELGLELPPDTPVTLIPNLSAFVGGDITAGIYFTEMAESDGLNLLLDIGTNNEMVLGDKNGLYACSAAAGPALEGAQISTGMRAAPGAVEKVWLDQDELRLATINDAPPCGLCGSGLIDLLAVLVRAGVILPNGRFAAAEDLPAGGLRQRLRKGGKRHSEFVYCRAGELGAAADLTLTQKDIREAQLAKSAIAVGIDKLLERENVTLEQVEHVYLAGAFGNYIDQHNACYLGILPQVAEEKIVTVHNSAGLGVCRSMYDPRSAAVMARIGRLCRPLNLAAEEDFQQRFLTRLEFTKGGGSQ